MLQVYTKIVVQCTKKILEKTGRHQIFLFPILWLVDNKHRKPVQQQILKTTKTLISQWYLANNTYNVKNSTMGNLYLQNTCLQKEQITNI